MEDRKRTLLALAIVCVVLLAVVSSFLPNIIANTPSVVVADPDAADSKDPADQASGGVEGIPVEIGPQTVQSVVDSLERYESYSRTMTVEYFDGEGRSLGTATAQVWADGGWTRSSVTLASGAVEHSIVGEDTLWLWYDEGKNLYTGPASERVGDLTQRLPTYEDVLALDKDCITQAGYVERGGLPCVYVEAVFPLLGYVERYWVSEASGLLMAAETEKDGVVVYSMTSNEVVSPLGDAPGAFELPDGTVLYVPGE